MTSATGHLDVAVHHDRVTVDGPHRDVGTAAEADDPGLGRQGHERRCQGRVDGVATVLGHTQSGRESLLPGRGNGYASARHPAIFSHHVPI